MTATDELRRMLDERGIEYRAYDEPDESIISTQWEACGFLWDADDREERIYLSADRLINPEQAIDATLGDADLRAAVKEVIADMDCDNCYMLRDCKDNNKVLCDKLSFHAIEELRGQVMDE